jgi:6-phosphogluconolactonase (cycloisomerase 2 family)
MVIGFLLAFAVNIHAGFLYVINQQNAAANQIYGFSVNESSGALSLLAGFPISSGGTGINSTGSRQITIDRANRRLYVINDGSNTVSAFSIDPVTGALTPLLFSPIALPAGTWATISVHPSGSPLIVGDADATPVVASFNITATTATAAAGSPYSTGMARSASSAFSRDGSFLYTGGSVTNFFAGFGVNPSTGVLTALPGSPYDTGAASPSGYAADSKGRLFMTSPLSAALRAFTTGGIGVPAGVTGNPFASALALASDGVLHPNERFYYAADSSLSQVGGFQISGDGAATALAAVAGSPVNSAGSQTNAVVFNSRGGFLFAINTGSRNISTYIVNGSTGALTIGSVQAANTLGATGNLTGIAYQPTVFTVTNTNDSGAGSLRQAVLDANTDGGGVIIFEPTFFAVPRTILLTTGQISLLSNIIISSPAPGRLTIQVAGTASAVNRAFNVGTGATAFLTGLTLTGGNVLNPGGAIFNSSLLTLSNCVITGNTAASVGGGIRNQGASAVLNIVNTTIHGNTAIGGISGGGGIDSTGTLFIANSTISGNTKTNATGNAGGIFSSGTTTLTNSTVTRNAAAGTGGASGVLRTAGTVTVRNTIIAENQNNAANPDVAGAFADSGGGFNLIGNVGTATGFNQTGDQTGTGASPLNPGLVKVLALNGGTVPTHALLPNSPAVDKGSNFNATNDQRGFARPFDNPTIPNPADGADIGAFERRAFEPNVTAPFDFDGDNKTDISIFRPSDGSWWYLRSANDTFSVFSFGVSTDILAPGDFTGDGKEDITVFRPSNGTWFIQRSEDNSFFSFPFGQAGDLPAPADFDGDGKTDAAVFRPSSGTWFILNSGGGGTTIVSFGTTEDKPVTADYDGDGRSDIAVFRPSDGSWWYLQSSDQQFKVYRFGVATDKAAPGDWTGDGKADIAVFRPSTGFWFIQRSEDNSFFSFPFGTSGDIAAPGDYDGDGRTDAAVFRPAEGNWFVLRSTAGTLIQQFGTGGDRPVPNAFVVP